MVSATNLLILIGCTSFFAYRGYSKGLFITLLGIIGFFSSYVIGFWWGDDLAAVLVDVGVPSYVSYLIAYPLIFTLVMTVVLLLPRMVSQELTLFEGYKVEGAIAGSMIGLIFGLIAVWLISVVQAFMFESPSRSREPELSGLPLEESALEFKNERKPLTQAVNGSDSKGFVSQVADEFVASTLTMTLKATGSLPSVSSNAIASFIKRPKRMVTNLHHVLESDELKHFWSSENAQMLMATNELDQLTNIPEFNALMHLPEFHELILPYIAEQNNAQLSAEIQVAEQLTLAWKKLQRLKHDPKVISIIQDPEIRSLAAQGNPAELLTHPKVQNLMRIISRESSETRDIDYTQFIPSSSAPSQKAPVKPIRENITVYKWVDDQGVVQYTEGEDIPLDKRGSATKIQYW